MEHVPDPHAFLAEASRCLKPGGRLLTVPFAARWHYIPHDYWRCAPSALERLLSASGFDHIAVYARGNPLTVACYKVMALMLPFLIPQQKGLLKRLTFQACGILTLPLVVSLAGIGTLSLRGKGGDDCFRATPSLPTGPYTNPNLDSQTPPPDRIRGGAAGRGRTRAARPSRNRRADREADHNSVKDAFPMAKHRIDQGHHPGRRHRHAAAIR